MDAKELIAQANAQQPQLIAQFKQAVASEQLAHAFLFTGPRGRGQDLVADWLAMRLMCRNVTADGQPDGMCDQCQRICLLYTSPSPRDGLLSRMPSSA